MQNSAVVWNGRKGAVVYVRREQDYIKGYQVSLTANPPFSTTPFTVSQSPAVGTGMPPGIMTLSANGSQNGIVWAYVNQNGYGNRHGILDALDANHLTPLLFCRPAHD